MNLDLLSSFSTKTEKLRERRNYKNMIVTPSSTGSVCVCAYLYVIVAVCTCLYVGMYYHVCAWCACVLMLIGLCMYMNVGNYIYIFLFYCMWVIYTHTYIQVYEVRFAIWGPGFHFAVYYQKYASFTINVVNVICKKTSYSLNLYSKESDMSRSIILILHKDYIRVILEYSDTCINLMRMELVDQPE